VFRPANNTFFPYAALNSSAALLRARQKSSVACSSELLSGVVLYLLIII